MDTDFIAKYERIQTWAYERIMEDTSETVETKKLVVVITRKNQITKDMILNPEKYEIYYNLRVCSVCGSMQHNCRYHRR